MSLAAAIVRAVSLACAALLWLGIGAPMALAAERAPDASATGAAGTEAVKSVLWLAVAPRMTPGLLAQEQVFRATLKAGLPEGVTVHAEYLEMTIVDDEALEEDVVRYLAAKYARKKLDLVAVVNSRGLRFVVRHRDRLFPAVPVAFGGVDRRAAADIALAPDVSGAWLQLGWVGTLDAARRLQPDLEQVVVVTGASAIDRSWEATARAQLEPARGTLAITYMGGLSIEAAMERVAALPARTAVLLGAFLRDGAGRDFLGPEIVASLDLGLGRSRLWDQRHVHRPRGGRRTRRELGGPRASAGRDWNPALAGRAPGSGRDGDERLPLRCPPAAPPQSGPTPASAGQRPPLRGAVGVAAVPRLHRGRGDPARAPELAHRGPAREPGPAAGRPGRARRSSCGSRRSSRRS